MSAYAMVVPAAVRILGICALAMPAMPVINSLRRVHSPAAISKSASSAPSETRVPGPNQPCSIDRRSMKKPPQATAKPPAQTTHCVPKRSSILGLGLATAAAEGGEAGSVAPGGRSEERRVGEEGG